MASTNGEGTENVSKQTPTSTTTEAMLEEPQQPADPSDTTAAHLMLEAICDQLSDTLNEASPIQVPSSSTPERSSLPRQSSESRINNPFHYYSNKKARALKIIKTVNAIPEQNRTPNDRQQKDWAENIVPILNEKMNELRPRSDALSDIRRHFSLEQEAAEMKGKPGYCLYIKRANASAVVQRINAIPESKRTLKEQWRLKNAERILDATNKKINSRKQHNEFSESSVAGTSIASNSAVLEEKTSLRTSETALGVLKSEQPRPATRSNADATSLDNPNRVQHILITKFHMIDMIDKHEKAKSIINRVNGISEEFHTEEDRKNKKWAEGMIIVAERAQAAAYQMVNLDSDSAAANGQISPSQVTEREIAIRVLDKLRVPENELNEDELLAKAWSKGVVRTLPPVIDVPNIGEHSQPESRNSAGQSNQLETKSNSNPSHPGCWIENIRQLSDVFFRAVVDYSDPEGAISPEKWVLIERGLLLCFKDLLKEHPGDPPKCKDAGWFEGNIKVVACVGQRSVELYELAIKKLNEIWPKLELITKGGMCHRPQSTVLIPAEPSDPENILELLRLSNPSLPTYEWKVPVVGENVEGKRRIVLIFGDYASRPLRSSQGEIYYGFSTLTLDTFNKDNRTNFAFSMNAVDAGTIWESNEVLSKNQ